MKSQFGATAFLAAVTGFLLAACTPIEPAQSPPEDGPIVGLIPIDSQTAKKLFQDICVTQSPQFANSEKRAEESGMAQSGRSSIYFHPILNVSVKVWPRDKGTCSMVFASTANQRQLERALNVSEDLRSDGMRIRFYPSTETDGTKNYRVVIEE